MWFRLCFGLVSFFNIFYRAGSVHGEFRFMHFLAMFGSVRFGFWTCNALVLPFRSVRKANIDQCSVLLSCRLACKLRPWYIVQATMRFSIWKPCRSNFKCNVQGFVTFAWKNGFLQHAENCINTSVFAVGAVQKHCKYRGILPLRTDINFFFVPKARAHHLHHQQQ